MELNKNTNYFTTLFLIKEAIYFKHGARYTNNNQLEMFLINYPYLFLV